MMHAQKITEHITAWLIDYLDHSGCSGFVVGVSGGVDSALVSTLCALTKKKTLLVRLPIGAESTSTLRAKEHIEWLKNNYKNCAEKNLDLTEVFDTFQRLIPQQSDNHALVLANVQSRLRMSALYAIAQQSSCLVVGTGNKIEDFEIGFFTKYGDGGVDISPIADLTKTQVFLLATYLGISADILQAAPSDGLFSDQRTDEMQIGASYPELEWAMNYTASSDPLSERGKTVLTIYRTLKKNNLHKMQAIPVCKIPESYFK